MPIILQTASLRLEAPERPEVSREDGGHLKISPRHPYVDRMEMPPEMVCEMSLLSILAGKALRRALGEQGIELGRINFQDNGNWVPQQHLHIYGRAINAVYHPFGHPIRAAWTKADKDQIFQAPLNNHDLDLIRRYILEFAQEPGFAQLQFSDTT